MHDVEGIGIGLRMEFARELLERKAPEIDWLEVHPENYIERGGLYPAVLKRAVERWPFATHGLTMCLGSAARFDADYLQRLNRFLGDLNAPWHSDHLCFAGADGTFLHDLLPLPFNEDSLETVAARFREAQDALSVPLAFENVSYYAPSDRDDTDEVGFVVAALERTGAKMLLDVNNVYVNSRNHGFDPKQWIDRIPADRVVQIHVAGHLVKKDGFRIDTHGEPVCDDVYDLLEYTLRRIGPKPVLLERDGNYPPLDEILAEARKLRAIYDHATQTADSTSAELPC